MIFNSLMMVRQTGLLCIGVVAAVCAFATNAMAQVQNDLSLTAAGQTVTASFSRNTPCTPYTIAWGDGSETVESGEPGAMCIQVIDTVDAEHTYRDAGTYDVAVTVGDDTVTETVTVPREVPSFDLDDVASITSEYVDPEPQMADEEYYIHTITLDDGTAVTVQVAAFTTSELRAEAFAAAGYTGDVAALLDRVTETDTDATDVPPSPGDGPAVPPPAADGEDGQDGAGGTDGQDGEDGAPAVKRALYEQLVSVLTELVTRLQQLLGR